MLDLRYTKPGDQRTLHFPEGALKNWDNLEDVEIQVRPFRPWVINMLPLASVDEASGVAKTGVSATYAMGPLPGWVHNPSGSTVWVENILEALDEPGEWVVNTKTRKVYLWPSDPASDGSPRGILAPSTSELIRVEGTIDYDGPKDTPVRGIAFSGLTFTHADRWAWTTDETSPGLGNAARLGYVRPAHGDASFPRSRRVQRHGMSLSRFRRQRTAHGSACPAQSSGRLRIRTSGRGRDSAGRLRSRYQRRQSPQ